MPQAKGIGGPALLVDETGASFGTPGNPLSFTAAPAGAATIADGTDVCEGAVADAATTAGGTGTISAKLRKVTTQLNAVGLVADAAQTDPAQSANLVQILKGILTVQNSILAILQDVHDGTAHTIKTSTP